MTLRTRTSDGRYQVTDGVHVVDDLSRDEWMLLVADFVQGSHTPAQLFEQAARRHVAVSG